MSRNQPDKKEAAARPFWAMEAACARAQRQKGGGYPRGPEGRSLEETEKRKTGRVAPCGGRHWRCEEGSHQEVNALSSITALRPRPFFWREMLSPNSSARGLEHKCSSPDTGHYLCQKSLNPGPTSTNHLLLYTSLHRALDFDGPFCCKGPWRSSSPTVCNFLSQSSRF